MESNYLTAIYALHPVVLGAGLIAFFSLAWRLRLERRFRDILLLAFTLTLMIPTWNVYALYILKNYQLTFLPLPLYPRDWIGGPLIYVIIKTTVFPQIKPYRYWRHALPLILFLLYYVLINKLSIFESLSDAKSNRTLSGLWGVMMIAYTLAAARIFFVLNISHKKYASTALGVKEKWTFYLLLGYALFILIDIAWSFCGVLGLQTPKALETSFFFFRLSYIVFLVAFIQKLDIHRVLSTEDIEEEFKEKSNTISVKRLSDDVAVKIAELVEKKMAEDKMFLDPNIGLRQLAEHVGVGTHELSEVLNGHMKTSFYAYINAQRIIYAKGLLATTDGFIVDITVNSGFSSRSSFYNTFKQHTGMTPKQYRASLATGNKVLPT